MAAVIVFTPESAPSDRECRAQQDYILRLLSTGDSESSLCRYREATLTYYSIFQPALLGESSFGLRRLAPIELYEKAASRLELVATRFAEELMERRCLLSGESPDGATGVPRGALNLYLISNQHAVFTRLALQYAVEELSTRNINRFLMSSVRARLDHLQSVAASAPLLREEKQAMQVLACFEAELRAHLAPFHRGAQQAASCSGTSIKRATA